MPRLTPFFILVLTLTLLILLSRASSGHVGSIKDEIKPAYLLTEVNHNSLVHTRKVLVEVTLDYDFGGHNNKHDPLKGKPGIGGSGGGGGGKNP